MGGILNTLNTTFPTYNCYNMLKARAGMSLWINMNLHMSCKSAIAHML